MSNFPNFSKSGKNPDRIKISSYSRIIFPLEEILNFCSIEVVSLRQAATLKKTPELSQEMFGDIMLKSQAILIDFKNSNKMKIKFYINIFIQNMFI
jgi:hypothetical protein